MNNHLKTYGVTVLLLLLIPFSATGVENVRLQLKWRHQFQSAGYYAAQAQGFYEAAGMKVEILPALQSEDPLQQVIQGKAEFGVGATDLLLLREKGAPVVVLASIFQHSPQALMALKKNDVQSIHDLAGAKIMMEPDSAELLAYLQSEGVATSEITFSPYMFNIQDLLSGKVDAMSVYVTDEPFLMKETGLDYLLYSPRAVGIDFYSDNLFTMESLIKKKPAMVAAFREASLKGWDYAMRHQEEIVQLIYTQYSQEKSIENLRFEAKQMEPLFQMAFIEIGHMNPGRWRHIAETYAGMGMIRWDFDLEGFLYDIKPAPPDLTWIYASLAAFASLLIIATFIAIRFARLSAALRKALDDVRTLRGIVPICMHCKRIRDDQGYWSQVETYIHAHTEAEFSHGICPDCMKTEYPEYCQDASAIPENE